MENNTLRNYRLRAFNEQDVDSLVEAANNYKIAKNLTNKFPYPYQRENGEAFIKFATDPKASHRIFTIEVDGKASGGIGLHPQDDIFAKNAELGYWLAEPFWGRGIITNAVKEMIAFGFANMDINRIFARPFGSNEASKKVLEKTGFSLEAKFEKTLFKFGNYEDEWVYAIRKDINA